MYKFSIIIPVYNGKQYIQRCVHSLQNQTFTDFEVIFIDDGSTDGGGDLLEEIAYQDSYSVIHQKNSGQIRARYAGLLQSKGEYILFLDVDDTYAPHALEKIYAVLKENDSDIVLFDAEIVDGKSIKEMWSPLLEEDGVVEKDFLYKTILESRRLNNLWLKCFRKEMLLPAESQLKYAHIKMEEDLLEFLPALDKAEKIWYISDRLYQYYVNPSSFSRSYYPNLLQNMLYVHEELTGVAYDNHISFDYQKFCVRFLKSAFVAFMQLSLLNDLSQKRKRFDELYMVANESKIFTESIKKSNYTGFDKKEKILLLLFKIKNKDWIYSFLKMIWR